MPVAVLEKGKAAGSHLLSGAVVNPRGLQRLFRGRKRLDELPFYGEVEGESVLFLTKRRALRIPTPPTMVEPPQLRRVALAASAAGSPRRRRQLGVDDPPRDVGGSAAGRRRPSGRRAHG